MITRTPLRISFFGGGTDYPVWADSHGGAVITTAVDLSVYITARWANPRFYPYRSRVVYRKIEEVTNNGDIEHRAVRAALALLGIERGVEIHYDGDVPGGTGLGSSSAFLVGLLLALQTLLGRGHGAGPETSAKIVEHLEHEVLGETVGLQDPVAVALGGFRYTEFHRASATGRRFTSHLLRDEEALAVRPYLLLCYVGGDRVSSEVAHGQVLAMREGKSDTALADLGNLTRRALGHLHEGNVAEWGPLLGEAWRIKKSLGPGVSTPEVDLLYDVAIGAGATGGKLLGAGGGGFLLLFAAPWRHAAVANAVGVERVVPFRFSQAGSHLVLDSEGPAYE